MNRNSMTDGQGSQNLHHLETTTDIIDTLVMSKLTLEVMGL